MEPRGSFTVFHLFHRLLTLIAALQAAIITGMAFGGWLALLAFVITAIVAYCALGYIIGAVVFSFSRRCQPQRHISYLAVCHVILRFQRNA